MERWHCGCGAPGATLKVFGKGPEATFGCSACGIGGNIIEAFALANYGGDREAAIAAVSKEMLERDKARAMAEREKCRGFRFFTPEDIASWEANYDYDFLSTPEFPRFVDWIEGRSKGWVHAHPEDSVVQCMFVLRKHDYHPKLVGPYFAYDQGGWVSEFGSSFYHFNVPGVDAKLEDLVELAVRAEMDDEIWGDKERPNWWGVK